MEPPYARTPDGSELTFGVNHLGHFALSGPLLDRLLAAPGSRVATMTSQGHLDGAIDFEDLHRARRASWRSADWTAERLTGVSYGFQQAVV